MNIRKVSSYPTEALQKSGAGAAKPADDKNGTVNGTTSDRVQLSKDYQDLAQAQKAMMGTEEIRTEKVEQVKRQLANGTYEIKPAEIADRMLDELI